MVLRRMLGNKMVFIDFVIMCIKRLMVFAENWLLLANRRHFFLNLCGGTLGTAATTGLLYQPRMIGDGDCGEIGGMKIGRGSRSTRRKPATAPLCPPQIPHG
jgi:hypothetical protein